ncbi:transposase domain-containing protein [Streptomyces bluensis]|uniref:transposase domain-containing protein n=1 Tax=Streptomyces bluensis TaxID=33897 RepID=UPI0019B7CFA6|nr:transposase domain-containing protein [Streptomyces bluensis]GGZ40309.1 hypothetical protein GCM10010344_01000 [Streptomyces bluensis]
MGAQSALSAASTVTTAVRPASPRSPRRGLEPRFGDRIRLGVLTEEITPEVVDVVLELTGKVERRRRLLPARAVVYIVLALCLFSSSDSAGPAGIRTVLRTLTDKLRHRPCGLVQRGADRKAAISCAMSGTVVPSLRLSAAEGADCGLAHHTPPRAHAAAPAQRRHS